MLSLTFLIGQVYWQQFLTAFVGLNSLFFFAFSLKSYFCWVQNSRCIGFSVSNLKMLLCCVKWESAVILCLFFYAQRICLSSGCCQCSPRRASFEQFTMCFGMCFFMILMLVTHWTFWICGFIVVIRSGHFSAIISSGIFSVLPPLPPFFRDSSDNILGHMSVVPKLTDALSI